MAKNHLYKKILIHCSGIVVLLVFFLPFFYEFTAQAAPASLTYQGRIVKSDGKGLAYNNVSFVFQITDPVGQCVIYQEQVNGIDMTNSEGVFDVPIGNGTIQFPLGGATSILDVFNNSSVFTCGSCSSTSGTYSCVNASSTYTASSGDVRKLRVSFYDGTGWKTITPDNIIRSVPFAGYALSAQKLGTNVASDFLLKAGLPTCSAGNYLTYDGTNLTCSPVIASGGGTVASVTSTNAYLTVVNGNSAPALTVNVGTTANTVAAGNDSRFTDARTPTGAAGGSLSGTYPNPTLIDAAVTTSKINDGAVTTAKLFSNPGVNRLVASDGTTGSTLAALSCSAGQLLTWNVATGWQCTSQSSLAVGSATTASTATNFSGSLVGDVGGTQGATSVNKIKGIALDFSTAPTNGQVLKFNGTSWAPSADNAGAGTVTNVSGTAPIGVATGTSTPVISLANGSAAGQVYRWDGTSAWTAAKLKYTDLVNVSAGSPWPTTTCASGEAVTWSSASDSFSCTSLTIGTAQLSGTLNAAQMPAFTGGDVTSSAGSLNLTLANSGVTASTYKSVTVDAKGRVTAGTNPTTLSGYGITDAIKNLGGVGNMSADLDANKPGTPSSGDLFVATDTQKIYRYNGASWDLVSSAGGTGGTVTSITAGTGLTGGAITGSGTIGLGTELTGVNSLSTTGFVKRTGAGAYSTSSSISLSSDISGTLPVANGGTGQTTYTDGQLLIGNSTGNSLSKSTLTAGTGISITNGSGAITIANTGLTGSSSFSGDVSGTASTTSVDKIKGTAVSATAPTSGQFLVYDGTTQYAPVSLSGDATISTAGALTLKNTGTAGTYTKVTTDAQGRVTSGTTLSASDIPSLDWAKITTGKPTTLSGYGVTDAIQNAGNTPSVQTGTFASRPAFGTAGRLYISSDTNIIYRDTGVAWVAVGDGAGSSGVTSVTASAPLSSSGGATPNVTISQANTTTDGYVSSTDWNTFNNKQNASTELTGVSGLSTTGYVQRTGAGTYSTTSGSTAASNNTLVQRDGSGVSNFYGVGVTGATSGTVTQRAPATVTSYSVTWPSAVAGTANSVLASDTSGNLSWINLGSVAGTINLTSQVTGVLPIANGGTNSSTALTNNQLMFSNAGAIKELGAMTDGQIVIGKSAASPQIVSMSGDVTILNTGATTVGKINGTTVTGVGLADSNLLQNTSGGAIAGNSVLVSNGTGTGVTSLSTPVSSVLTSTGGSVPTWSSIASDTFTQYALLAGRSGGQTLYGGSAASNNLTLDSTSHATKGNILLNPSGGNVGIGTTSPVSGLNTVASSNSTNLTPILDFGTGAIFSRYVVNNFSQTTPVTVSSANTTDSNLFYTDLNPSANLSLPYNGIEATLTNPNGASFGSTSTVNGINSVARLGGNTATYSTINAIQANMQSYLGTNRTSEVALNAMTSILNNAQNAATLTNQIPVNISASNSVSNSTVTNQYGINISMANSGTVTNRYGIYIAGTNMGVQTNTPFDIYASDAGAYNYFAGNVGIGTTSPGYNLDVNGSVNATAFYLNGTSFSPSATSTAVAAAGGQVDAITQSATDAASASRSVLTLRNNGAGGNNEYNMVGLNASGAVTSYINQAGAASFVNSVITPTLYGNSTASANLTLDSTSNATKGNIILAPTGGNVGIGTTTPSSVLSTSAGNNTTVTTSYYSWPTNSTQYVTNQYNNSTITAASSATSANLEQITLNPSSSLNQTIYGHQTYIQAPPSATFNNSGSFIATAGLARDYSSVGTGGYQYGGNFQSVFAGVATRNALYGITSAALIQNYNSTNQASVVGNLYGGNFAANNNSTGSSVTSGAYAINAGSGNSGTIASQYGLNISLGNSSTGTITNRYGVYVNGSNSGTLTNTAYDIYANTSNAYNYFAGNVGIGITNPDQKLTVMGNIRAIFDGYWTTKDVAGITYLGASGGTGAANWALRGVYQYPAGVGTGSDGGDLDLIKSLDGNTVLGTKTDGTPLGNVGIGTTTPTARFEVNGTRAYAAPADSWGTVQKQFKSFRLFGDSGVSTAQFVLIGRYSPGTSWALGSAPIIRVAKTYFDSQAAWTEYVVDRSGNLKLVRNSGDLTNWLKITPATSYGGRSDVYELWLSVPSYNEAVVEFEHISGFSTIAGTAAAYAVLEPAATNSPTATDPGNLVASSVAGTVFSGGNVGIGTANPSSKLEISTVSSSGSQSTTLTIGSGLSGSASGNAVINFVGTNNGTASTGQIFSNYLGGMIVQPSNSDPSVTINGTSGNVANTLGVVGRAVIGDQTWVNTAGPTNGLLVKGNVGIGTTSPTYQLQLSTDSAAKPGTSTWTIASDERLKDIRAPFDRGLASIEGIHPIYFNYKKDNALDLPSEKEYVGIKAQDALKAVPEAVSQDDKGYYHVTNDAIIWTVLNAVKELYHKWLDDSSLKDRQIASIKAETEQANAKASKLEAENAEKDKEIKDLKARLERIEKMLQSK